MPFQPVANPLTSPEWAYFNQRVAEMKLDSVAVDAHGIMFCPVERLPTYGILGQKLYQDRPAILFPYVDENGRKQDFYHARMIGGAPEFDAPPKGMTREGYQKILSDQYPRYLSGKQIDAYFPILPAGWLNAPYLFITEGIPKAIRATRGHIPCISIQGKDMFKVKGTTLLVPALERILKSENLKKIVYIADSDARHRDDIRASATHLVGMLNSRRQSREFAQFAILPDLPNRDKVGLDDYLNDRSEKEFWDNLANWMCPWEGGAFTDLMDKLNQKISWIQGTTTYFDLERRQVITASTAAILTQPLLAAAGTVINPHTGAKIANKSVTLNNTFNSDPYRNECAGADFWPGMPDSLPDGKMNMWKDYTPDTVKGDITPFLQLLDYTVPDATERNLLLRLVTHRALYPQEKSPLMVFLTGQEGTGKTCCATALFNAITSNPDYMFLGGLNLGYAHEMQHLFKQAVCLEEPTKSGMTNKDVESYFKLLGDSEYLHVEPKGIPGYQIRNRGFYWINTNERNMPASGIARRWLVLSTNPVGNEKILTKACWDWMQSTHNFGGRLRYYLLQKFPEVTAYDLQAESANLTSKQEVLEDNKAPALVEYETFIDELPDELKALRIVPSRILMALPPYDRKSVGERQSITRVLSQEYPLVKVGNSQDGKVMIKSGVTTAYRVLEKGLRLHMTSEELKVIYSKWENVPLKEKY